MGFISWNKYLCLFVVFLIAAMITITGCERKVKGIQVIEYELTDENAKQFKGIMGIPENNNCPVVMIFHGAHMLDASNPIPYYKGFEYLVKRLAENGYFAISVDINDAYTGESAEGDEYSRIKEVFRENYSQLKLANEGKKIFSYNIKGKADLNKINLIGHSRGGDNITALIKDKDFRNIYFTSALKIAASNNSDLQKLYVDIPTALIYPQKDEDIVDISSANYYYYAYEDDMARTSPIISAYLYGANHNNANTLVNQKGMVEYEEEESDLDAETQRKFTAEFAIDFLDIYNKDKKLLEVFNNQTTLNYGIDFMLAVHDPLGRRILRPDEYMDGIAMENAGIEYVVSSSMTKRNTAGAFHPPGTAVKLPLYKISWEKAGGTVKIPMDGIFNNFTEDKLLSLYLALDSSDKRMKQEQPVTFDIILTDALGQSVTIPFSSETNAALAYQNGKMEINSENMEYWDSFTPLGTELIPLSQWNGKIMIDNIESLTVVPTSEMGVVMLGGIDLYEP